MTFTDEQLEAYVTWDHPAIRDLARALLDARKALEAVPHLRILAGAIVEDHQERSHNTETCVSIGGACNARRALEAK